jgi:carboxypeptidase D
VTVEVSDFKVPDPSELDRLWEENRRSMITYAEWSLKGIRGRVTDSRTGAPLAAMVRAVGIDHDVYTDPDVGDYHRMLLPGVYGMAFRAAGYYEETMTDIGVGEGPATRVDATLDPLKKGDVNGDREISLADAILALQVVAGIGVTDVHPGSDVDGDGRIGLPEALFCLSAIQ